MGGYGAGYLGWQIRLSDNPDVIKTAQDMHPKLAAGMGIFFALGAVGGMMSMIMQVSKQRGRRKPSAVPSGSLWVFQLPSLLPLPCQVQPRPACPHTLHPVQFASHIGHATGTLTCLRVVQLAKYPAEV